MIKKTAYYLKDSQKYRLITDEFFDIREITLRRLAPIKLKKPFYDATMGPFLDYELCFLRLTDQNGFSGECQFPSSSLGLFRDVFVPILLNTPKTSYGKLYEKLFWSIRNEGFRGAAAMALGHLDRVFYDLVAKRTNLPVFRYLGGNNPKVRAYASGGGVNLTESELLEQCLSWQEMGYGTIKIKFGGLDTTIAQDIDRVMMIREALDNKTALAIDANQSMSLEKAVEIVGLLRQVDIAWLEEPIHSAALVEIEELCKVSPIPIAYGESERSYKVFPSLIKAGVHHLQPIAGHISSIENWFEIVDMAQKSGLDFSSGGTSQINAQFVAAVGETALLEYLEPVVGVFNGLLKNPPKIEKGWFILSEEPGLGIDMDWEYLRKANSIKNQKTWKK